MTHAVGRRCISCGVAIGPRAAVCPACGALNTHDLGDVWTGQPARHKQLNLGLWIYTVRGGDAKYVEVKSAFGLRTVFSRVRWILSNLIGIIALTLTASVVFGLGAATGEAAVLVGAVLLIVVDLLVLVLFLWSMTP